MCNENSKFKDFLEFAEENPVLTFFLFLIVCSTIGEIGVSAFNALGNLL